MAKDDYFVIVYQLLKYLYDCLKTGEKPEQELLSACRFSIPVGYWGYIVTSLWEDGMIKGVRPIPTKDGIVLGNLSDMMITPKGIQYLFENSLIEKVKNTLRDVKDIVSFI